MQIAEKLSGALKIRHSIGADYLAINISYEPLMKLTWFDANAWLWEAGGCRILVDPWLVGDLVFANSPWLVKGIRPQPVAIPPDIDLILLSQGLADHAHPETLQQIDKSIPVVASVDGAEVAKKLGYQSVTVAAHGDVKTMAGVEIRTFTGAVVGPQKRENAYVLTFLSTGIRLYYEPHGYPDVAHLQDFVENAGPVDVVISPMADITLMGIAPVIRGTAVATKIAKLLKPQVMLPTAEDGQVIYEGLLAPALSRTGGAEELRSRIEIAGNGTRVIQPISGELIELDLQPQKALP